MLQVHPTPDIMHFSAFSMLYHSNDSAKEKTMQLLKKMEEEQIQMQQDYKRKQD